MDRFSENILRGPSPLSIAQRELIAAYVSGLNECNYCYGTHSMVAIEFGISQSLIEDLIDDLDNSDISKDFLPILRFVKKLTVSPSKLVRQDAQDVYDKGWSERALHDVICLCSLFNYFNRFLDGHGIKGHDNLYKIGARHLAKKGYKVPWFIKYIKGYIRNQKRKRIDEL